MNYICNKKKFLLQKAYRKKTRFSLMGKLNYGRSYYKCFGDCFDVWSYFFVFTLIDLVIHKIRKKVDINRKGYENG